MPKLKTKQALAKRFRTTKSGKIMQTTCGQDHFNARESGKTGRNKKRDHTIDQSEARRIRQLMPYK
jgi:large subunit ribosomal protein L35